MFTVRRISYGVGVERTFPVHSPRLEKIVVARKGVVRRAKLYYLRTICVTLPVKLLVSVNAANLVHKGGCKGSPLFC